MEYSCAIEQVNPLPFMKRYCVYDINTDTGERTWVARFKNKEDAIHFVDYRWGKPWQ